MYTLSVPISLSAVKEYGAERYSEILKELGATRVFMFCTNGSYMTDAEKRRTDFSDMKKYCRYFKEREFEAE